MAENSNISWTDNTFSPWIGCAKVSDGCKNCYAEEMDRTKFSKTLGGGTKETPIQHWGKGAPRYRTSAEAWKKPLRWDKTVKEEPFICRACGTHYFCQSGGHPDCDWKCEIVPYRPKVFFSLGDPFDEEVPIEWLADYLTLIHDTPNLDHLLLTKRPENWNMRATAAMDKMDSDTAWWLQSWDEGKPPENVWLGTSVENQEMADKRIPELLKIPAKVRFLSCEPLLSEIDLSMWLPDNGADQDTTAFHNFKNPEDSIHQVIAGGESGPKRREMKLEWMTSLYGQCKEAGVPFFCKQTSALRPGQQGRIPDSIWNTKEFPKI